MDEESNEELDSQDQPTEEVVNTEEVEEVVGADAEETEDNKQPEYTEAEKKAYARMKKAEAEAKDLKAKLKVLESTPAKPAEKQDGITAMDTIALIDAKVTVKEDIDEVVDYAKFKGISVAEALKATAVKSILAEKAEQRTTAEASNTATARRGSTKISDEQILANVNQGKYPETPEALAEARFNSKIKK